MSKMSFQQKRKHRSILPSNESIEEEVIFEFQKTKSNKSILDFKSPKLNRLKNFIKSPVQKSYNKYKQFQDNEEDKTSLEDIIHEKVEVQSSNKESIENTDSLSMSTTTQDDKDKSQASLLTTISSVPPKSLTTSPVYNYPSSPVVYKHHLVKHSPRSLTTKSKNDNPKYATMSLTGHSSDNEPHVLEPSSPYRSLVKSVSSSGLADCQGFDDYTSIGDNVVAEDKVDGAATVSSGDSKNGGLKWNGTVVDIEMTEIMLQSLDEHIKSKRDKISKDVSQKEEMVDKLISNFTLKSDDKSSKKIRREYEAMNKNAEKSLEKTQIELEQLEYKRLIVSQEGIPWGVKPAEYVKNISKKDRNKKNAEIPPSSGIVARFLHKNIKKSASAENISQLSAAKSNDADIINHLMPKAESVKKSKDTSPKYLTLEDPQKASSINDQNSLANTIIQNQSIKKAGSAGNSSAISCEAHGADKTVQNRKSKSNSVSSYTGRDQIQESTENHDCFRNQSLTSADDTPKSDEMSLNRFQMLQEEIHSLKKDIQEVRSECHRFQCETDNLKLDLNTNSELNFQKMQNSIEHVDRLERILDILRQQCQIEFCTWKDGFHNLEEKLDYRLTTTRRDLQDNIDACNNSISLVEKKTEQLPFMSSGSGKSDMKIITDHLCNLVVSLIAFFMLLISSGFHLLIRFLNIGATISQNRNTILIPLIICIGLATVVIKWSLFTKLQSWMFDSSDYTPL